jgi:hypothetical protein
VQGQRAFETRLLPGDVIEVQHRALRFRPLLAPSSTSEMAWQLHALS